MTLERITYLKPTFAATLTGLTTAGNIATWAEFLKGWAAVAAVVISVPTGLCMLIYWLLKARKEWRERNL